MGALLRELARVRGALDTVLGQFGIPYSVDGDVRITQTPLGHALAGLLRFAWGNGTRNDLFAYLRSPFSGLERRSVDFVEALPRMENGKIYKRLLREFQSKGRLMRAFYYTALIEDQEYSSIRPLIDWLDYNGYSVVTKATKEFVDQTGRRKVKGNMDIELAVDAMELAPHIDHMVLFSGDGDFRRLVEAVQRRGVRVSVVSVL